MQAHIKMLPTQYLWICTAYKRWPQIDWDIFDSHQKIGQFYFNPLLLLSISAECINQQSFATCKREPYRTVSYYGWFVYILGSEVCKFLLIIGVFVTSSLFLQSTFAFMNLPLNQQMSTGTGKHLLVVIFYGSVSHCLWVVNGTFIFQIDIFKNVNATVCFLN